MKAMVRLRRLGAFCGAHPALALAHAVLIGWALGLAVSAFQLGGWREQVTRTLMQLNADAHFRARVQGRDGVDPEWYRRKALGLLATAERLQRDAWWTVFIPGSWQALDALEEQVQGRVAREFSDIVVETMRRELYARAGQLTGVPLVRGSGDLNLGAECQSPVPQALERRLTSAAEDLPEFVAVSDYVGGVERLDDAVQAFFSLQYSGGESEQLRKLVAYTLGKELPGALAGAVRMFQRGEEVSVQPGLMQSRLQWATRCSLAKAMSALHTRLLQTNDLFALEQDLVERSNGMFEPAARQVAFDRTLERYRAVHTLLEDQHALLAKGRNDWMGQATLQLGPAYQEVLKTVERTRLLGPDVVQQLHNQSGAAFAEFRRQFELAFGARGEPGIVWLDGERRFGLSTERAAMREGLGALLKASFMSEDAAPAGKPARENAGLGKVLQEARALAGERARAVAEIVPVFPEHAQPVVARVIDARISDLVYHKAARALKASLGSDVQAPLETANFRQQREQVLALQAVLKETGGSSYGDRLVGTLDNELLRRLASLHDQWRQQPLHDPRTSDFSWWQGEQLPLAQTLGAAESPVLQASLSRTAARLDLLVQQARGLLTLGSPALANDPAASQWQQLNTELERYTGRAADSSLLRLERYITALGTDLRRDNCSERLAANAPAGVGDDEVAQRHLALHRALSARCGELRTQALAPSAALPQ